MKASLTTKEIFAFQWSYEDVTSYDPYEIQCNIYIWGWNAKNEGVCVRINDFKIPMWIELPKTKLWTDQVDLTAIENHLKTLKEFDWDKKTNKPSSTLKIPLKPWAAPHSINIEEKKRLYNSEFELNPSTNKYDSKLFPFFTLEFSSEKSLDKVHRILEAPQVIAGFKDPVQLSCVCAKNLTPVMKLTTMMKLPSAGWISFDFIKQVSDSDKISTKQWEYIASFKSLKKHPNDSALPIVHPKVCSFDIETYSSGDHAHFPDPLIEEDIILQIGCVFAYKGTIEKVCLTLGPLETDPKDDFKIISCANEKSLLMEWTKLIRTHNPDVLIGYNIFGFDIRYMYARGDAKRTLDFLNFGCLKKDSGKAKFVSKSWESKARGKVEFQYFDAHGRLFIDLLPFIKSTENLESYKLETVAAKYLSNINKDPIKPKDIFESWADEDWTKFYKVAKYCVQDTYVTFMLFEKLLIWFGLVESATANKVPIFCMVSQGQQIKAFAQVFDYCFHNNMVCNPPFQKAKKSPYRGAIVTDPVAGLYKTILPFDFASLYPTIIIAHNIDFSRLIPVDSSIPEDCAPTLAWEDHQGCDHDPDVKQATKQRFRRKDNPENLETEEFLIVAKSPKTKICKSYNYRFLSSDAAGKGAIPSIIDNLLVARKKVRKLIEQNETLIGQAESEEEIKRLKEINQVLDKRQLAYKVNANSMYGMFGAEMGYLPFFPGAECVTYIGRRSILQASDRIVKTHGGKVIYNDTDSAYCNFSKLEGKSVKEIWEFAMSVVKDIETLFPAPMKLEFEEKIYSKFLIFGKKRYIAEMTSESGKIKDKLYMRGVPLVRREYISDFKNIYETCVNYVLKYIEDVTTGEEVKKTKIYWDLLNMIMQHFIDILSFNGSHIDYLSTPSLNVNVKTLFTIDPDTNRPTTAIVQPDFYNKFVIYKGLSKDPNVFVLQVNPEHSPEQVKKEKEKEANHYSAKSLVPAHVAVARKIVSRGTPVLSNTRIEYVLLANTNNSFDKNEKQSTIAESLDYYKEFRPKPLNILHYINSQYVNNLDQLILTIFGKEKTATKLFGWLVAKNKTLTLFKSMVLRSRTVNLV
jgi:DNA polymerase elongation subunit (family B)